MTHKFNYCATGSSNWGWCAYGHTETLFLCIIAFLPYCLVKRLREENIGRRRRGRRNEQIYLGINRFGSTIQDLSAAFSTSLFHQWGEHKTSDWKVSSCLYSILGKNLKKKKIIFVKWSVFYASACSVPKQSLPSGGAVLCLPWLSGPKIR